MPDLNTYLSRFLYSVLPLFQDSASGAIHKNTTAVGNVGSGEDTLMSYSLPANTLNANNKGVRITAWGKTAANGNNKTIALYFGIQVASTGANATNNGAWRVVCEVLRTGSSTQDVGASISYGVNGSAATTRTTFIALTETDTAAITIRVTGEGTSDNDVVQEGFIIELI